MPKHYTKDKNKRVRLTVDPDDVALDELHAAHPAELAAEVDLQAEEVAVVELPAGAGGACVLPGVVVRVEDDRPHAPRAVAASPLLSVVHLKLGGGGLVGRRRGPR